MEQRVSDHIQPEAENQADIKVLLLDTPENQGVDFLQSLKRDGLKFIFERVGGKDELLNALKSGTWDILLVNDQVSEPGLAETQQYLDQVDSDAGYIMLSSETLSIETLTHSYQQRISDVVSNHHPEYSREVIGRAVERSRRNFQLTQLNQEKFELARHRDQLMSGTKEALAYLQDGIHVYGNQAYLDMLGYKTMEEVAYQPFIDIVSTEMRDKTKQALLDFQHSVRVNPKTEGLELEELYLSATGDKEGILEVQATFKPVVYDGEDCLQVIIKDKAALAANTGDSTGEGLGYPLFLAHLENFIAAARTNNVLTGQVIHISSTGFEHYIASKGFGSLNGKLKALASELKRLLDKEDFFIRFTETSFLILIKGQEAQSEEKEAEKTDKIGNLLAEFQAALNKEVACDIDSPLIKFAHNVIPVNPESESAELLIKSFLLGSGANSDIKESGDGNVVPFARKDSVEANEIPAAEESTDAELEAPQNEKINAEPDKSSDKNSDKNIEQKQPAPAPAKTVKPEKQKASNAKSEKPVPAKPVKEQNKGLQPEALLGMLEEDGLELRYEAMISVAEIETEFYDLGIFHKKQGKRLQRSILGAQILQSPAVAKLDLWVLSQALGVVAGQYKLGQECRVIIPMTSRTLDDKRHADVICKELSQASLPPGMITLDFTINDLSRDLEVNLPQLNKFKQEGANICASGVRSLDELIEFQDENFLNLVRLDAALISKALSDEGVLSTMEAMVEIMHGNRIKVAAININNSSLLSVCCKAQVDLVTGQHIQPEPLTLTMETLSEVLAI